MRPHRGSRSRGALAPLGFAAALAFGSASPALGQEASPGWEIRSILDSTHRHLRRMRPFFLRQQGAPLRVPPLGARLSSSLQTRDWLPAWPGLGPDGAAADPVVLSGHGSAGPPEATGTVRGSGGAWDTQADAGSRTITWADPADGRVEWTTSLQDEGERLITFRPPRRLPFVPEEIEVDAEDVTWVIRYSEEGDPAWALAFEPADTKFGWAGFWSAPEADAPADLAEALRTVPATLIRTTHARFARPDRWAPLRAAAATLGSIRYNRVEGASLEVPVWVNLAPTIELRGWGRFSTTGYDPTGGVRLTVERWPGSWGIEAYRRLEDANPWEPATRKGNSLRTFLYGLDDGHYFTASGASVWTERRRGARSWRLELFGEEDERAATHDVYSLFPDDSAGVSDGLVADEGVFVGLRGITELQWGLEPPEGVTVLRLWGDAAGGDDAYVKAGATVEYIRSAGRWGFGARAGGGRAFGEAPLQRQFFVGGVTTARGFKPGTLQGPTLVLARAEAGYGPAPIRGVVFGDLGMAGRSSDLDTVASVGLGLSLASGFVRLDLARAIEGGDGFKFYLTGNGLL